MDVADQREPLGSGVPCGVRELEGKRRRVWSSLLPDYPSGLFMPLQGSRKREECLGVFRLIRSWGGATSMAVTLSLLHSHGYLFEFEILNHKYAQ